MKRRGPSRSSRLAALTVTLVGTGLTTFVLFRPGHTTLIASGPTTSPVPSGASSSGLGAAFVDGTYTGAASDNKFGTVQVAVTVSGGRVTGIDTPQVPGGHPRSVDINSQAVPMLTTEALAAQSAAIDNVTGATYTSDSYKVSLQSALDQLTTVASTAAA